MILIDMDGVIIDTVQMFIRLNNKLNNQNDNYLDVEEWNFKPCVNNLKSKKEVDELFKHPDLYKELIFFDNAIEVINRLNEKYNIAICTMGESANIRHKLEILEKVLPNVNLFPVVNNTWTIKNKDIFTCDILIDDSRKNLDTCNAKLPVLFEPTKRYKWNDGWRGEVVNSWLEFERMVDDWYINQRIEY